MRRLIKNKLRSSYEGSFRRMFDPSDVVGVDAKTGRVMLKSQGWFTKTKIKVDDQLSDNDLIYLGKQIDAEWIRANLKSTLCWNPMSSQFIVAKFSLTDTSTYAWGALTVTISQATGTVTPYVCFYDSAHSRFGLGINCSSFYTNKYGTYGMFAEMYGPCYVTELTALDIYHIDKLAVVNQGTQLTTTTNIYVDTTILNDEDHIFTTDKDVLTWDATNKKVMVNGATAIETKLDGFVAIFNPPHSGYVLQVNKLCYYEEA